jgi:hypothetical protein
MQEEWETLVSQDNGFVAVHTILVLWRAKTCLPDLWQELSGDEQNILLWACLMHDLRKMQKPLLSGKDHVHPFKSGACVLEFFAKMGLVEQSESLQCVLRLIRESVQPIEKERMPTDPQMMTIMQSHHNLDQIFALLWGDANSAGIIERNGFVCLIFRLVFFHQSIFGTCCFQHMYCLSEKEQLRFCDP